MSSITSLCKTYERLEQNNLFYDSPQKTHLAETIAGMFENLSNEDKIVLSEQLGVHNESRWKLLSILKIENLPKNLKMSIEESVMAKLLTSLNKLNNADLNDVREMKKLVS